MNNFIKLSLWVRCFSIFTLVSFSSQNLIGVESQAPTSQQIKNKEASIDTSVSWKKFHSVQGKCKVAFPQAPEHVKQIMTLEEDKYDMQYDVYVATEGNKEAVYMVLIAQYPPYVNESCAELSLECFLNGILTQHPSNELVFADLVEIDGKKGMDFFIKSKGMFFKGRALMSGSNLYLIAMECEEALYKENKFTYFINSFEFVK
jgi:hypothetical protein